MRQPVLTDILPIVRAAGEIILRRFGCTALELCYIACGRADGQFEFGTKPWDIAAGWLILREAGGEVVSVWGGVPPLDGESAIVSTNGSFTEELRKLM